MEVRGAIVLNLAQVRTATLGEDGAPAIATRVEQAVALQPGFDPSRSRSFQTTISDETTPTQNLWR